jgi:drug/metabolite transporter (DMT)-like permease
VPAGAAPTLLVWGAAFLLANVALQYGVARLPANVTAVVMLSEILVAAGSAWLLGGAQIRPQDIVGGLLIIAAPWILPERESAQKRD